jgi:hypothetical protein
VNTNVCFRFRAPERPKSPAKDYDNIIHRLESFTLTKKLHCTSRSLQRKRLRSASGGDTRKLDCLGSNRAHRLPPKTFLRRSKLDHLFKNTKRPVSRASSSSSSSKRAGSAPPEHRTRDSESNEKRDIDRISGPSNPVKEVNVLPKSEPPVQVHKSCSQEAAHPAYEEVSSVDELAGYLDNGLHIPKKMSKMAEMMYT